MSMNSRRPLVDNPLFMAAFFAAMCAVPALCHGRDFFPEEYGAKGDGTTLDTAALQSAIDNCAENGGGRVVLADGTFLTGALALKSGVELHLARTGRLLASPDILDFPEWKEARHVNAQSLPRKRNACVIFADEAERISITGEGTIDGNGRHHVVEKEKGDSGWGWTYKRRLPMEESLPRVVFFTGCRDVRISDVTMVGQPAGWSYWIHDCDRVQMRGLKILADLRYPNNDGIHLNCSRDVVVSDCIIETGDDSIVVRADSRSLKENRSCERVVVENCILRSWAQGIRIGYVNDGVIRNCSFSNIVMDDTVNGIGIVLPAKPSNNDYGREATLIENISFDNIRMDGICAWPIYVKIDPSPGTRVEAVRDVRFSNVHATARRFPNLAGRADAPLRRFDFSNCSFSKVPDSEIPRLGEHGSAMLKERFFERFEHVEDFTYSNVRFNSK